MDVQRQLEERVVELRRILEQVVDLARESQGDWSSVAEVYAPLWTHMYKEIADVAERALEESEPTQ